MTFRSAGVQYSTASSSARNANGSRSAAVDPIAPWITKNADMKPRTPRYVAIIERVIVASAKKTAEWTNRFGSAIRT